MILASGNELGYDIGSYTVRQRTSRAAIAGSEDGDEIMAKGGGKNVVLLIIAVAAIGGAIYGISTMGNDVAQNEQYIYFLDPQSVNSDPQVTARVTVAEFANLGDRQLVSDPDADARLEKAGVCPHCGKYYLLIGHGEVPPECTSCKASLSGYDKNGNLLTGG